MASIPKMQTHYLVAPMLIITLNKIAKIWKQPKYPIIELIKQWWYIYVYIYMYKIYTQCNTMLLCRSNKEQNNVICINMDGVGVYQLNEVSFISQLNNG